MSPGAGFRPASARGNEGRICPDAGGIVRIPKKHYKEAFEKLWPLLKQEREWRLQDDCGGDEVRESVERLHTEALEALGIKP